jgi:3-deoxy-D-manno-octulosonate 8-phosphate phosphatase (KDO 8-P phosphatase)
MEVTDKSSVLKQFMKTNQLPGSAVLYMGDDIPDLQVMQLAGLPCCPADAVQEIREIAVYISHLKGGDGCGRDVIEKVMKLRGDWSEDVSVRSQ